MKETVCLITGASSGIGLAAAKKLAVQGAHVIMVGRDPERSRAAFEEVKDVSSTKAVELHVCDFAVQAQVRKLATDVLRTHPRIHVLINNAGGIWKDHALTPDGVERTFAVNHLAAFILTNELIPALHAGAPSRIINVSSEASRNGRLETNSPRGAKSYSGTAAYCNSKLANLVFTFDLARRLRGTGITVNAVHPGAVRTRYVRDAPRMIKLLTYVAFPFMTGTNRGSDTLVYLASSPDLEHETGKYWANRRPIPAKALAHDPQAAAFLWRESMRLSGLEVVDG